MNSNKKTLSQAQQNDLLEILRSRFEKNKSRHKELFWQSIQQKLEANSEKIWSLYEMEISGGEPDIIEHNAQRAEFVFYDCSVESPIGRRNLCYDEEALKTRKENKPISSALKMAEWMGVEILREEEYRRLQKLGKFDTKTSSWIKTPSEIRRLGGALFGDNRYQHVFTYHNGASSYYSSRGFRALLRV